MPIPKMIHYCWFGGSAPNRKTERLIADWKVLCPDYEIVCWNEDNCDVEENEYVRGASRCGKWAFGSDYFRLKALYEHGGVYLDTDVELLKPFGELMSLRGFMGFESGANVATCVIGGEKEHEFFRQALDEYNDRAFLGENGEPDLTTNVQILTRLLCRNGLERSGARQSAMGMEIFPEDYFSPNSLENA